MTDAERQALTVAALRLALHPHERDHMERAIRERIEQIAVTPMPVRKPHRPPMPRGDDGRFTGARA